MYVLTVCHSYIGHELLSLELHILFFSNGILASASSKPTASASSNLVSPDGLDLSKSFAQLSLPTPLQLVEREPGKGLSVVARTDLAPRTQFGPLQGEKILERDVAEDLDMRELWQVFTEDGRRLYLSTANPEKSNWLRYLRPAPHRKARNVAAVVKNTDRLHFVTIRKVAEGEELVYWMDDPDLMWTKKRAEKKSKFVGTLSYNSTVVKLFVYCVLW